MKILEREIGSISFAANQTRTLELPRNYAYRSLGLLLKADLTRATTAGTSTNTCRDAAPAQLIKNIMVRANGRDVIKNYDMETLHRLCEIRHHVRPFIYAHDWAGGDDATDKVVEVAAQIDFAMWDAIHSVDTLLDSAGLATLELIITWGTGMDTMDEDWIDEAGATVTVNEATLYVSSCEAVGVPAGTAFMTNKEYMIRREVTSTSDRFQISLPTGNMYRVFVIKTHQDGDQTDLIMVHPKTITIKAGTEVFKYRIAHCLQADNRLSYELQVPERIGSGAALDHAMQELTLEGYYVLEFVKDGRLTECLNTAKLSSLELELQVAVVGTVNYVDIYCCELLLPAVKVG